MKKEEGKKNEEKKTNSSLFIFSIFFSLLSRPGDNTVVLQASGMAGPVKYARYLFADWPVATLYATTAAGDALPAFPFLLQVS